MSSAIQKNRREQRVEFNEIRRELFGNRRVVVDETCDITKSIDQLMLVVWMALCHSSRTWPSVYTPREALSAGWMGLLSGLVNYSNEKTDKPLRHYLLMSCRLAIKSDAYCQNKRASNAAAQMMKRYKVGRNMHFSELCSEDISSVFNVEDKRTEEMPAKADLSKMFKFPDDIAPVAQLYYGDGLTLKEVAARLSMNVHTAHAKIGKARIIMGAPNGKRTSDRAPEPKAAPVCSNCGETGAYFRKSVCHTCYQYKRKTGRDRTPGMTKGGWRTAIKARSMADVAAALSNLIET